MTPRLRAWRLLGTTSALVLALERLRLRATVVGLGGVLDRERPLVPLPTGDARRVVEDLPMGIPGRDRERQRLPDQRTVEPRVAGHLGGDRRRQRDVDDQVLALVLDMAVVRRGRPSAQPGGLVVVAMDDTG